MAGGSGSVPRSIISDDELQRRFTYHPPTEERAELHREVDRLALETARKLVTLTPPGREQSIMLTRLEEVRMRANQAIATGE